MKISKEEIHEMVKENFIKVLNEQYSDNEENVRKLQAEYQRLKDIAFNPDSTPEEKADAEQKMKWIQGYKTPYEIDREVDQNGCYIVPDGEEYLDSVLNEGVLGDEGTAMIFDSILDAHEAQEIMEDHGFDDEQTAAAAWFSDVIIDGDFNEEEFPKYNQLICDIPYTDCVMYYDYGADYYFAVKKNA